MSQRDNTTKREDKRLSLHPLQFEEAVGRLLKVKPIKKDSKQTMRHTPNPKSS